MPIILLQQTIKSPLGEIELIIQQHRQLMDAKAWYAEQQILHEQQHTLADKPTKSELHGFKKRLIEHLTRDEATLRKIKLVQFKQTDFKAFANDFRPTHKAHDLLQQYGCCSSLPDSILIKLAGRIMTKRVMGKASFVHIQDTSGQIQAYLEQKTLGDSYTAFKSYYDIGDIVGIDGHLFFTQTGELTIRLQSIQLLVKSLLPLPEKFHGLKDTEQRYRQRYLDLMINADSRQVFLVRSKTIQTIRQFFLDKDFLEVETPIMQPIPGGASAKPFITHHNALDRDLYLRIAPELYLKRLIVGGFERVFEINRSFRNEGLSPRHNPEFTMMEFYQAYADYHDLMNLTEQLFSTIAKQVLKGQPLYQSNQPIQLDRPFQRLSMKQAILQYNERINELDLNSRSYCLKLLMDLGIEGKQDSPLGVLINEIFEATVEQKLIQPTFITQHPVEISPLARRNDENANVCDRFELFIAGQEIANGFSELNDAQDQAERFAQQAKARQLGDDEAMFYDQDYITALQYGMPPTAGQGIGIDRLIMLLCQQDSIRDVILFPQLRSISVA